MSERKVVELRKDLEIAASVATGNMQGWVECEKLLITATAEIVNLKADNERLNVSLKADEAEIAHLQEKFERNSIAAGEYSLKCEEQALLLIEQSALVEKMEMVIKQNCPNYIAHPQAVWFSEHLQRPALDIIAKWKEGNK